MHLLFTSTAGVGHLHPLVPLARAAADAGHDVSVAAPASLGPALAARGLPHLALPDYGPHHRARVEEVMGQLGPPGPGSELLLLREVFGWAKTDATLAAMRRLVADHRPDLVLHEAMELSGPLAAEAAGIPHAAVAVGLRRTLTDWMPAMAEGAAELATSIGLPADPEARRVLDVPFLTLVPPSLETSGSRPPAHVLRYRLTDLHAGVDPGWARRRRAEGPLVWIALGTEAWRLPGMAERLAPLLRATTEALPGVRFLLTTGDAEPPAMAMPANVEVTGYVPQEQVLEACDVVLAHGGFNTTIAALRHGRPLVLMPLFSTDQFETAQRLAEVGAALTTTRPDPPSLRALLEQALTDTSRAAAAQAIAEELAALPTPAQAVAELLDVTGLATARR